MSKQRRHICFAQADNVGQEYAAILIKHLPRIQDSFLLVLEFLEANRNIDVIKLRWAIQFIAEVFVQQFQVKLIWAELRIRRSGDDSLFVGLRYFNRYIPKFIKLGNGEIVVRPILQFDIELKVFCETRLSKIARPRDDAPFIPIALNESHDID
ncbi:MAG: hypothetical protein P4L87_11805, partial [Formivibrio sp.]|nr:hypothetical protein [Formivibrio sp.]